MTAFNTVNNFSTDLLLGNHIVGTHTFKVMLTNVAPTTATAVIGDITEIAAGNGYTAGGATTTVTKSLTGAVTKVLASDVVVTATGAIGPFQYEVLVNATTSKVIGWTNHGSAVTMANLDTHTIDFDAAAGVVTVG